MTGFGRTGRMFASEHEAVIPDMIVMAKGLNGGYLPLAITLVTEKIFSAFDESVAEGKALAYGHSYTGNALACAAAKASLEIFEKRTRPGNFGAENRAPKLGSRGSGETHRVKGVRQCGFIAGIEIEESANGAQPNLAAAVCVEARRHGLLTKSLGNVIVLMPSLCITMDQLTKAVEALRVSITEVWNGSIIAAGKNVEEVTA